MKVEIGSPPIWEGKDAIAATWTEGDFQRFGLLGRTDIISAKVEVGKLLLFPERSAQHKVLFKALGLDG